MQQSTAADRRVPDVGNRSEGQDGTFVCLPVVEGSSLTEITLASEQKKSELTHHHRVCGERTTIISDGYLQPGSV